MVKSSDLLTRVAKYDSKTSGSNVASIEQSAGGYMSQQGTYQFQEQNILEHKIKLWHAALHPHKVIDLAQFLSFGKEVHRLVKTHVGTTLKAELNSLVTLWHSRGPAVADLRAEVLEVEGIALP